VAQALRRRREEGVALGHRGRDRRGRLGPVLVGRRIPEDRRIVSDGAHGLVERLTDGRSLVVGDDDDGFPWGDAQALLDGLGRFRKIARHTRRSATPGVSPSHRWLIYSISKSSSILSTRELTD